MKYGKYVKSMLAGFTAMAVAVTMVPAAAFAGAEESVIGEETVAEAEAEEAILGGELQEEMVEADNNVPMTLHWDMTKNPDGTLKDLTNNNHNGRVQGATSSSQIDGIEVLNLNGGYVDIPDGTISTSATELTVNMLVKITQNTPASWMWALGSSNKRYLYFTGCCSSGQGSKMRGGACAVPDSLINSANGWDYETVITGDAALDANVWQNITITYGDGGEFAFYRNGALEKTVDMTSGSAGDNGVFTLQQLMYASGERDGYMGKSFYPADPNFQGAVADFRIYESAMDETEVSSLQSDIEDVLAGLQEGDFTAADVNLTSEDCLGENTAFNRVTTNLVLPTKTTVGDKKEDATITKWVSSNPAVISDTGVVTRAATNQTVTMTATVTKGDITVEKPLTFTVLGAATDQDRVNIDANNLTIFNADDIRGNITLPTKGELGSTITWASADEAIISTKAQGSVPAGVVNRQKTDKKVKLTATLTYGAVTDTKEIICTVKKAVGEIETTDYLFAYFPYVDGGIKDERIYFGISEDGLNYDALNDGKYVLESKLGTHGLRDPFIIRSPEGDKFYLIATDLTVAGVTQDGVNYPGMGWGDNQTIGSQSIMVWESDDLVNWSDQRMCKVAIDTAGCTWAPEAYWDDETKQYVVFWASRDNAKGDGKQRVYYATTRDFNTFSEAQVWIEESGSVIDTTVIKVGEWYYRYSKNEDGNTNQYGTPSKRVYCERSKSLTSTDWALVHKNSLDVSGGQIEGATIFQINTEDVANAKRVAGLVNISLTGDDMYCLAADMTGRTVFPGLSTDITAGNFAALGTTKGLTVGSEKIYSMPEPDASHGTIMPITSEEYDRLMKAYNTTYATDVKEVAQKAEEAAKALTLNTTTPLTSSITLPTTGSNNAVITWTSSNSSVMTTLGEITRPAYGKGDATVEMTAKIVVAGTNGVRDQVQRKSFVFTVKEAAAKTFTVKFDRNGGSAVASKKVTEGKKVTQPKNPTRRYYVFSGWYLGSKKYNFNSAVKSNITLKAKWTKVSVKQTSVSSLKNMKVRKITVKAKKITGAAGYEYKYSTSSKFTKKTTKTKLSTKNSLSVSKLKKGKTYYVKVRAYKKDSKGQKVYGKYSKTKKVTIKK